MAGSQKNRPVDPDIEDNTTFEEVPTHRIVSAANMNVVGLDYTMKIDGIPVTDLDDSQIFRVIQELAQFMDGDGFISDSIKALSKRLSVPLKLHDPKPLTGEEVAETVKQHSEEYTPEMQQTDFAHQCLDYVLKRDMPEAVVNVDKIMNRGNCTVRIIGEF